MSTVGEWIQTASIRAKSLTFQLYMGGSQTDPAHQRSLRPLPKIWVFNWLIYLFGISNNYIIKSIKHINFKCSNIFQMIWLWPRRYILLVPRITSITLKQFPNLSLHGLAFICYMRIAIILKSFLSSYRLTHSFHVSVPFNIEEAPKDPEHSLRSKRHRTLFA